MFARLCVDRVVSARFCEFSLLLTGKSRRKSGLTATASRAEQKCTQLTSMRCYAAPYGRAHGAGSGMAEQVGKPQACPAVPNAAVVAEVGVSPLAGAGELARGAGIVSASHTAPATPVAGCVISPPTAAAADKRLLAGSSGRSPPARVVGHSLRLARVVGHSPPPCQQDHGGRAVGE
jgi:hypothetical protein